MNTLSIKSNSKISFHPELSIVVPVYKEEKNIPEFLKRVVPIVKPLVTSFEIIFAMDPSPDKTEEVVLEARRSHPYVKLLKFSRRFGQPMATLAGLQYSTGDAVVVMDVDMQDPPEVVKDMILKWREGNDVVLAQRRTRDGDTWIKKIISNVGYKIINKIADPKIPPNTGDFRLMSRRVVNEIVKLKEVHGFLRGLVAVVGFKQTTVIFDRPPRFAGETNHNPFFGTLRIGLNGIICFSNYFLTLSTQIGFVIASGSIFFGLVYAIMKIAGFPFPIGNPTIVILVLFMGGIQLITIGVLGEYIGRIYEEVKERPKFIVDRAIGFSSDDTTA
ncbi:MAG: glycosyltransferase family 2 protein [Patescibacteria group bacterium]